MRTRQLREHHRIRLLILVALLLAVFGVRTMRPQASSASEAIRRAADTSTQKRVVISLTARRLWVIDSAGDTLRAAPVAVGSGRRLTFGKTTWYFATPVGIRHVLSVEAGPVWSRPDWAYVEIAQQQKLKLDSVSARRPRVLSNGDSLVVRGADIGVVKGSSFEPWPYEKDLVFAGVLYMPPVGSPFRIVPGALGQYRLNLGNSIGLHGTLEKASIGKAVTHGCMRLDDDVIEWLYRNVPVGTPVFIY